MLSKGAVTKFAAILKSPLHCHSLLPYRQYHLFEIRVLSGCLLFTWLNMAPFREFEGQTRGHFVIQKKANRQKTMLTYQFGANLKSVSCIRVRDQPSPSPDELHQPHSR